MCWDPPDNLDELKLERVDGRLEMRGAADAPGHGICVDLGTVRREGMRKTPLGRALGEVQTVVDATAGLCHDAFLMALMGCTVTAVERSPMLAALVEDGLARAAADPRIDQLALARLNFVHADARALLPTLPPPDAVLIDPMFPAKRKSSALPRKEIRLVRAAVGHDEDAGELLAVARACALRRVLVKRADDSRPIEGARQPHLTFGGSTSRVDVYLVKRP